MLRGKALGYIDAALSRLSGDEAPAATAVPTRWWTPAPPSSPPRHPISTRLLRTRNARRRSFAKRVRQAGDHRLRLRPDPHRAGHRVRLLARSTASGRSRRWATRSSSSTTTPRRSPPTTTRPTGSTSSPCTRGGRDETSSRWKSPVGVVVAFGGQTAIKPDRVLRRRRACVSSARLPTDIDTAEDRERFDELLERTAASRARRGMGVHRPCRRRWTPPRISATPCCCARPTSSAGRTWSSPTTRTEVRRLHAASSLPAGH